MNKVTVLYPGSFKPMTGGHLSLIKKYADRDDVQEVRVFIGPGIRNGINQELAYKISKELTKDIPKVKLLPSEYPTPILTSYKVIENAMPGIYCLAASSKGDDYERVKNFVKEHTTGKYATPKGVKIIELPVDVSPEKFKNRLDEYSEEPISASVIRNDIINKDYENFKTGYPFFNKPSLIYSMLKDNVVKDGKNAIKESRSLTEKELLATYDIALDELSYVLDLPKESFLPIGSFNKKPETYRYGDIDIALDVSKLPEFVENPLEHISTILNERFEVVKMPGFNQVTIGYPINGDKKEGIAQIDLMLTENLEWSKFAYDSPNLKNKESKYKAAYSSFMKMSIISESFKKVEKQDEKGNILEYSMISMRLNSGLWKVTKTHEGKKGRIKTSKIKSEEFITDDPSEVLDLMFGSKFDKSKYTTFEYIWNYINTSEFPHTKKLPEIISKFKHLLKGSKLPEPDLNIIGKRQLNDHMYHIEQLIFDGEEGLDFIRYTFKELCKQTDSTISVKIDGAPAMLAWSKFPGLRDNGVGIKTVFNKEPVTCHSSEEIDEKFGDRPELAAKLKQLLLFTENMKFPEGEIWQGDYLFDAYSKETDNRTYVSFRPNTIKYTLDLKTQEGIKVLHSTFGICWHTRYVGNDIQNITPKFNIDLSEIYGGHPSLYQTHPYFEMKDNDSLPDVKSLVKKIEEIRFNNQYKEIINYKTFNVLFQKYHNSLIKEGKELDFRIFKTLFYYFVKKEKNQNIAEKMSQFITDNEWGFKLIFELIKEITNLKNEFLNELNKIEMYKASVDLKEGGSKPILQEGFALSSPSGKIVKIVNRAEFFYLNSSPDIINGWEK